MSDDYDVIIIGTGAGGGTLAHRLAPSGKRILLLERGGYLPREPENWDSREVFLKNRYVSGETWYDKHDTPFEPHAQYFVGGNTKVYGAILFRFREKDFGAVRHYAGTSPVAPLLRRPRAVLHRGGEALPRPRRRPARTPPSRAARARSRTRPSRTSRGSSSSTTTSSARGSSRSTCRSAST